MNRFIDVQVAMLVVIVFELFSWLSSSVSNITAGLIIGFALYGIIRLLNARHIR